MGMCSTAGLIEKMGPEFGKFMAIEKAKEFVGMKVEETKNIVSAKGKDIKKDAEKIIGEKEDEAVKLIKDEQSNIEKEKPGALGKAASLQRKSVDDLLGVNEIKGKFKGLKDDLGPQF